MTTEEFLVLDDVIRHHQLGEYRFKARGIIALNAELKLRTIADVLGMSEKTVYNWAKWWRENGFDDLFDRHKGGRPAALTTELIACAI